MSSSASSAPRLPRAFARVAPPSAPAVGTGGRHLAPEVPGLVRIAAPTDVTRAGRHLESEWSRDLHDPRRDEIDALDWLGFSEA
ncbi:MAG TPA: hypothetical protein VFJ97_03925 [Dermatophilaceae bacterium]|nr:hypothetical protein [Dermatophilaceae bacterium]